MSGTLGEWWKGHSKKARELEMLTWQEPLRVAYAERLSAFLAEGVSTEEAESQAFELILGGEVRRRRDEVLSKAKASEGRNPWQK